LKTESATTENNREAKYYQLTAAGRRALASEVREWRSFADAVDLVLAAEG